jgi:hypothetical protein
MGRKRKREQEEQAAEASLDSAAAELAEAEESEVSEGGGGGGLGKLVFLLLVAGVLALVLSKDLRSKALDALFGAEEEFDYSSTTMPAGDFSTAGAPAS